MIVFVFLNGSSFNEYLFSWPFVTASVLRLYIQKILPSLHWISNSWKRYNEKKYPFVLSRRFVIFIFVTTSNLPPFKLFWNVIPCSLVGDDHCNGGWRMWRSNLPPVYWTPRVGAFFVSTNLRPLRVLFHCLSITFPFLSFIIFLNLS